MKLPKSIKVGPLNYSVTSDEVTYLRTCRAQSENLLGHVNHTTLTIVLDDGQADDCMRDTLLHECLHGLMVMIGGQDELGPSEEERLVRRLSPVLLALLRDNPKLVALLTADDDDS